MKRLFIPIFMLLPLTMQAQTVLTPQEELEQAQKQLEAAQKALESAKQNAKKAAEAQAKAEEARKQQQAKLKAEQAAKLKKMQAEAARLKAQADSINAAAAKLRAAEEELKPVVVKEPTVSDKTINLNITDDKASSSSNNQSNTNNGWTVPTAVPEKKNEKAPTVVNGVVLKQDPKYLANAVPFNENGKIEFELITDANGKSASQIYDIVYQYMSQLTQGEQNIASRVALVNPSEHIIANAMDEWLVFNASFISLDRTEFKYNLIATIKDNYLKLELCRISYSYEEGRSTGFKLPAEEVISDKVALTKKKNDLAKVFGKFRRLTIDRKDQIFTELSQLVKQ